MAKRPSYRAYEKRKMGSGRHPFHRLAHMIQQSFMAERFARFWQNWNPLFSYYLLYFVYRPLRNFLSRPLALLGTFALSGGIHDLAAMLILRRLHLTFTLTFTGFALFQILEEALGLHLKASPSWIRPLYHLTLILLSYFLARELSLILGWA